MAYSDNLANLDHWMSFRPSFTESWMSTHETETLTKALQKSFSSDSETLANPHNNYNNNVSFHHELIKPEPAPTPTVSGSDPETTSISKRRNNQISSTGKISKRKSRATKRSPITFITADPINFREMVQQVTGIRIGNNNSQMPVTSVLKPEAKRAGDLLLNGYTLPTLDTSAFLLEHQHQQQLQQQQQLVGSSSTSTSSVASPAHVVSYAPVAQVSAGFDFDNFQSFPTLESWGVI